MSIWNAILSLAAVSATPPEAPVRLEAEPYSGGVRLSVIGEATAAVRARYVLEVSSDPAAGGNHSVQSGVARLEPGQRVGLLTLSLGTGRTGGWTARLRVEPEGAEPYEQVRSDGDR